MKIDYKNYPVLEMLNYKTIKELPFHQEDEKFTHEAVEMMKFIWPKHYKSFQKEIISVSEPFLKAVQKSIDSLEKILRETLENESIRVQGTFIHQNLVIMMDVELLLNMNEGSICIFDKSGVLHAVLTYPETNKALLWRSQTVDMKVHNNDPYQFVYSITNLAVLILLFKKYATVETKILHPNQKPREISCLYRNNTKLDILFLDCKWFTNLVKSEGFNVRGHFRLQPKKKNTEWTKELIWISEFHKTGYTAPARMLSQN